MAYIGNNPDSVLQGRKALYTITATAGQTVFSGLDDNGNTIDLLQAESNNVYLNGSRLVDTADFTLNGDVLTLTSGAASGDIMVITTEQEMGNAASYTKAASDSRYINYDGDIVNGTIQMGGGPGNNITFADNNKIVMGTGNDLEIYHDGSNSYIDDAGEGSLFLRSGTTYIQNAAGTKTSIVTNAGAGQTLYHNNTPVFETTATGIDVTGNVVVSGTVDTRDIAADGTKLDTVETNADVTDTTNVSAAGALMTTGGTMTGALIADDITSELTLAAIAKDISDTAVDIFVYNTAKDSDGGAWRKRTQHTSWYNETLNTGTRGARKEFPSVAVIVAEAAKVTIYDGDDPDMPMWMVFSCNHHLQSNTTYPARAITALNGSIVKASIVYGIAEVNFIKDTGDIYWHNSQHRKSLAPISGRNSTQVYTTDTDRLIVDDNCNDVAMTVLPNAPIDADTGLPVPTIAVATDGGVSVIKDNGSVVDIVSDTIQHETPREVKFVDNKVFWVAGNNYDNAWSSVNSTKIPTGDITVPYYTVTTANALVSKYTPKEWNVANHVGDLLIPINMQSPRTGALIEAAKDNEIIIGGEGADDQGTVVKIVENLSNPESGMIAQIGSDFATGYQVGDIKLATLSDTDATNVTGAELVTNGTFDSDVSGWTDYTSIYMTVSHASGAARITHASNWSGWYGIGQDITTVVGQTYVASYDVTESDSGNMQGSHFYLGEDTVLWGVSGTYEKSGTITGTFVATSTTTNIRTGHGGVGVGSGDYYTIDNFSVRLAEEDRSVNNKGLQVFGTITKTPVATGADLVAYSGFGVDNGSFLKCPIIPSAGTGDFSICTWYYATSESISSREVIFSLDNGADWILFKEYTGFVGSAYYADDQISVASPNTWYHICIARRNGYTTAYINGKAGKTAADTHDHTSTSPGYIGIYSTGSHDWRTRGSIALLRYSLTAPSAEQIKKMYEDEKHLFQENAKATLYGASDAVTALAYDDDTELLHVGTSAGRSVFQGLRRINNTTDAVGVAISASNGMVAED
jgi:trimeric autotransporter adhesin